MFRKILPLLALLAVVSTDPGQRNDISGANMTAKGMSNFELVTLLTKVATCITDVVASFSPDPVAEMGEFLKKEMSIHKINLTDRQVGQLNTNITDIYQKLDNINSTTNEMNEKLSSMESTMGNRFDSLEGIMRNMSSFINTFVPGGWNKTLVRPPPATTTWTTVAPVTENRIVRKEEEVTDPQDED